MSLLSTLNLGTEVVKQAVQPVIDILHKNFNPNAWFLEAKVAAAYAVSAASKTQFASDMQGAVGGAINLILSTATIGVLKGITSTDLGKAVVVQAISEFKAGTPSSATPSSATPNTSSSENVENTSNNNNNNNNNNNVTSENVENTSNNNNVTEKPTATENTNNTTTAPTPDASVNENNTNKNS